LQKKSEGYPSKAHARQGRIPNGQLCRLSGKRKQFLALTGLTLEEFLALLPAFQKCFQKYVEIYTLEGKKRQKRRYVDYANSPLRTIEDKLLFILIYLRKATTQEFLEKYSRCLNR